MSESNNGNYCMQCDANGDDDYSDAYKYVNDINQLRDTVIGYGGKSYINTHRNI